MVLAREGGGPEAPFRSVAYGLGYAGGSGGARQAGGSGKAAAGEGRE